MSEPVRVAVIGAGASGMMAAGAAAENGARVTLYDKNERVGRKLAITGKGRCNLTNNCDVTEFLRHVPRNPRFLYAALSSFSPADTMDFFEELGVPLKTERGRRVFPVSDRAYDIVDAMRAYCRSGGVSVLRERIVSVTAEDGCVTGVVAGNGRHIPYDRVIVATGGLSYPLTGSDGDGYRFARDLGIKVNDTSPSLVPLEAGAPCAELSGLTLKNVNLTVVDDDTSKTVFSEQGELLFAHFGITGPLVLSASAHMSSSGSYTAKIDLKPALDEKTLDARLISDFEKYNTRDMINACTDLLPQAMIPHVLRAAGVDPHLKCSSLTRESRRSILLALKGFSIKITGKRPIEEAIITSGGVDTKELFPKTMESRRVSGLYFCGEVIDVDAYTGGYNLQIAFSTGRAAGIAAAL